MSERLFDEEIRDWISVLSQPQEPESWMSVTGKPLLALAREVVDRRADEARLLAECHTPAPDESPTDTMLRTLTVLRNYNSQHAQGELAALREVERLKVEVELLKEAEEQFIACCCGDCA